jgi:hypothetical protein
VLQLVLDKNLARKGALPTANLQKVVYSFMWVTSFLEQHHIHQSKNSLIPPFQVISWEKPP